MCELSEPKKKARYAPPPVRVPQKEVGKRSSIIFSIFDHFLVTFSDTSATFFVTFLPGSFCRTPFVAGWPSFALAMLIVDFVGVVRGFRGLTRGLRLCGKLFQGSRRQGYVRRGALGLCIWVASLIFSRDRDGRREK